MIFEVEFADGTKAQISATNGYMAQRLASSQFKDKLIVAIRKAGLMGLAQRPHPSMQHKH
jgi:hypothetical protein